jgi:hypothetical protein
MIHIRVFVFLDIINVGDEPKIITLKRKTILSYSYDYTTVTSNFLVVQAHTQYRKLSLSTLYGTETNTNSDTAILKLVSYPKQSIYTRIKAFHSVNYVLSPPNGSSVEALVAVVLPSGKGRKGL